MKNFPQSSSEHSAESREEDVPPPIWIAFKYIDMHAKEILTETQRSERAVPP